jgi:hypothetical protein
MLPTPADPVASLGRRRQERRITPRRRLALLVRWRGLTFQHARVTQPPSHVCDRAAPGTIDERRSDGAEDNRSLHTIGVMIASVALFLTEPQTLGVICCKEHTN